MHVVLELSGSALLVVSELQRATDLGTSGGRVTMAPLLVGCGTQKFLLITQVTSSGRLVSHDNFHICRPNVLSVPSVENAILRLHDVIVFWFG